MGTHARIIVKLDARKSIRLNPNLLPYPCIRDYTFEEMSALRDEDPDADLCKGIDIKPICHTIKCEGKEYASIYHHWDGFPSTLGKELKKNYNTWKTALNLMCLGNCSTIVGGSRSYIRTHESMGTKWNGNEYGCKPILSKGIGDHIGVEFNHYYYLFDGEQWFWKPWNGKKWRTLK